MTNVVNHIDIKAVFLDSWQLFRKYFKEVILLALVVTLLQSLVQQISIPDSLMVVRFILVNILLASLFYIPQAIVLWIIDAKEHAHAVSVKSVQSAFSFRFLSLLFLVSLVLNTAVSFGIVLFVVPGIILLLLFGQSPFFVLFKKSSVRDAFSKSFALTKGNRFNMVKVGFLFAIVYAAIGLLIGKSLGVSGVYIISLIFLSSTTVLSYALWRALQKVNPTK